MSHSQLRGKILTLRHAWLNLWDKHMTTGRINQVLTTRQPPRQAPGASYGNCCDENIRFRNKTRNRATTSQDRCRRFANYKLKQPELTQIGPNEFNPNSQDGVLMWMSNASCTQINTLKLTNAPNSNDIVAGASRTNGFSTNADTFRKHILQNCRNCNRKEPVARTQPIPRNFRGRRTIRSTGCIAVWNSSSPSLDLCHSIYI